MKERILTYAEAIREGTAEEMARDKRVVLLGQGVDDFKGTWGTTAGLQKKFGPERVFDTPLAEDGMTGVAIGAALAGLRPIHVHIRSDFLLLAMNQLVNIAAKSRYMYGGAVSVPLVVRSVIGRSWGQGAQHSQALQSIFAHFPGLRVVCPSTAYDAKGSLIASIRDPNPVIFVEHRMLHSVRGHVPQGPYRTPLGRARVLKKGRDITIVGISHMALECLRASRILEANGMNAEVIDPIWLAPLDIGTILRSVEKTKHLLIVDCGWETCGMGAEIIAQVLEKMEGRAKDLKIGRMGFAPVVCPPSKPLEEKFYPSPQTIAEKAYRMAGSKKELKIKTIPAAGAGELAEFRGPF